MNPPFEMHIIQTKCEVCQSLFFAVPSPFDQGITINVCVELHPRPNQRFYMEVWGTMPQVIDDLPETRAKIASDLFIGPAVTPDMDWPQFLNALMQRIQQNGAFQRGIQELLSIHHEAHNDRDDNE